MTSGGRDAVLDVLRRTGSVETAVVANRLGLHPTTVRAHLDSLVESGLVTRSRAEGRTGRGRPPYVYAAAAGARSSRGYQGLASALAASYGRGEGSRTERARAAGRAWSAEFDVSADPSSRVRRSLSAAAPHLTRELESLGFEPRVRRTRGTVELEMWSCPYLEIARDQPDVVCGVHRGLLEGLLMREIGSGVDIELVPFATRDYCLVSARLRNDDAGA